MDCTAYQALMVEAILGELPEESWLDLRDHVEGCAVCKREWSELKETWELIGAGAEAVAPPVGLLGEITKRIRAADQEVAVVSAIGAPDSIAKNLTVEPNRSLWMSALTYGGMALAATFVGAAATTVLQLTAPAPGANQLASTSAESLQVAQQHLSATLEAALARNTVDGERFEVHQTNFATSGALGAETSRAALMWDRGANQIHFYAANLPPTVSEGDVYSLWLVDQQGKQVLVDMLRFSHPNYKLLADAPMPYDEVSSLFVALETQGIEPKEPQPKIKVLTIDLSVAPESEPRP